MSPDWLDKIKKADAEAAARAAAMEKALRAIHNLALSEVKGDKVHDFTWQVILRLCQEAGIPSAK